MVGFFSEPIIDDLDQASKLKNSNHPPDPLDPKPSDFSFSDSFLDFDSLKDWFEDIPIPDMADMENFECLAPEKPIEVVQDQISHGSEPIGNGSVVNFNGSEPIVGEECEKLGNLSCCIEEEMEKVSLVGGCEAGSVGPAGGNGVKLETVNDGDETGSSESESESSSSSSSAASSSGSSDEDEDEEVEEQKEEVKVKVEEQKEEVKVKVEVKRGADEAGEVEEGEIRDVDGQEMVGETDDDNDDKEDDDEVEAMVGWSDVDEDDGGAMKGPIKSKNELEVLPPVPAVDVTLQPHHQMLPVGVVLSIIGAQVIVEGVEKHNPLSEGSILWITKSRSPLGLVDEIFGPVKNPYYMVRYNSESEVPAGIHGGSLISFVAEFANHVLNSKDLYKKGYDASGANDEEASDEIEFSDDEKEAEYKRSQKMTKRDMTDQKVGNKKNNRKTVRNKDEPRRNDQHSSQQTPAGVGQLPPNQNQHNFSPAAAFVDHGNYPSSSAMRQGFVSGTGLVPPFPPAVQSTGFNTPNGVWTNGLPFQQPQRAVFPNGFPANGMPWFSQNLPHHPYQMPIPNGLPFQQQFGHNQWSSSAGMLSGEQSNIFAGPMYAQGLVGQNGFNQTTFGMGLQGQTTFGMGLQGQPNHPSMNMQQPLVTPGNNNNEAPQQFHRGVSSGRGRKPYRRGGGRFAGGRGWQQSK